MHTDTLLPTRPVTARTSRSGIIAHLLVVCLVAVSMAGDASSGSAHAVPGTGTPTPDVVGDEAGGVAARLHDADGAPLAGYVFLLFATGSETAGARVYDLTPYTHQGATHPDTVRSNRLAAATVAAITRAAVEVVDMTNAPGGGPSGGLTRAIAYLDIVSDGAFTGDLRVAATGQLTPEGHLRGIENIDAKTVAADLAGADVLFTPTVPSSATRTDHGARLAGEAVRDPGTGNALNDRRRIEQFRRWGDTRPAGMDIVDARHLIDVSAYLCGAGSEYACEVTERLDDQARQRYEELTAEASAEAARFRSAGTWQGG